jgi:hypothetical protein
MFKMALAADREETTLCTPSNQVIKLTAVRFHSVIVRAGTLAMVRISSSSWIHDKMQMIFQTQRKNRSVLQHGTEIHQILFSLTSGTRNI